MFIIYFSLSQKVLLGFPCLSLTLCLMQKMNGDCASQGMGPPELKDPPPHTALTDSFQKGREELRQAGDAGFSEHLSGLSSSPHALNFWTLPKH